MIDFARYTASLIIPLAAGYFLTLLILRLNGNRALSFPMTLSISFGMGFGILAQIMLLFGVTGIPFSFGMISLCLALLSCLIFLYLITQKIALISLKPVTCSYPGIKVLSLYLSAALFLLLVFYYIFWRALNIPVYTYDAVHFIAYNAKVLFFEKNLIPIKNIEHSSYPLQVQFIETWISLALGAWNDQWIKVIFPLALLSFCVLFFSFLKRKRNSLCAIFGVILLLSSNLLVFHSTISYRDIFLMYFMNGNLLLILYWISSKNDSFLYLASFFAGFGTFTKLEGTLYFVISLITLFIITGNVNSNSVKQRALSLLKYFIPGATICISFYFVKTAMGIPPEKAFIHIGLSNFSRIPSILTVFFKDLFLTGNWNIVWSLLVASAVMNFRKITANKEIFFLSAFAGMFFLFYFMNGLFTDNYEWLGGPGSITAVSRIVLHIYPVACALIVLLNCPEDR
ncbi:MAG: hypothetical protein HQL30_04220 [Candidatus Omnitrophica bacterium]|nr:hypothetical protein [Candidatus Omnitrophota bacterium]